MSVSRRSMLASMAALSACAGPGNLRAQRIELQSGPWRLAGDYVSASARPGPAVLLLNKANGDRQAYASLAGELIKRGVSSLRLDLRGHGESINAGRFVPFDDVNNAAIFVDDYTDVVTALNWLKSRAEVDPLSLGVVGASYSAELSAEAARRTGEFARAYVFMSPGSLSEETARGAERSGAHYLLIRAARERSPSVRDAAELMRAFTPSSEEWVLDAETHATDLFAEVPDITPRIADWLTKALRCC